MYHSFFIHSFVEGHRGCFRILAVVNSAALNIGVQRSSQGGNFLSVGTYPEEGLQGHVAVLFLMFLGPSILFSITAVPIYYVRFLKII